MPNIFLNRGEGRLRAFWRIVLLVLSYFAMMIAGQMVIGVVAGLLAVSAGIPVTDPQAVSQYIMNNPWVTASSMVISLIAILLSYLIATKLDRRKFVDFGFHFGKTWWADLGFGLFLGILLMVLIFVAELSAGWITIDGTCNGLAEGTFWPGMIAAAVQFLCVGIYEEMLFRGYPLRNVAEGLRGKLLNPKAALLVSYLITSSIFGLMHATNPNATVLSTIMIVVAGLFLGLGYVLTGDLATSIGIHITWNFFQGNVFGFPVSGTDAGATFFHIQQGGPELWTGGPFGPESGLIGLAAMLLGCLLVVGWVKYTRKNVGLKSELAVYTPLLAANNTSSVTAPSQDATKTDESDIDINATSNLQS